MLGSIPSRYRCNRYDDGQEKLEEEMKKRKERVEKWRLEQKASLILNKKDGEVNDGDDAKMDDGTVPPRKVWSLEDDDDDDEDNAANTNGAADPGRDILLFNSTILWKK